jgi:hypothetical protein
MGFGRLSTKHKMELQDWTAHSLFQRCVTTLALGSQPRQRLASAWAKRSVRECEDEDSHSQVNSHFGSWSPGGLPNLYRTIAEVKRPCIEEFFISMENY